MAHCHKGPPQCRMLLRDNVPQRAGEPGSGGHGATTERRRVANPRTTTKGRAIAQNKTRPRNRGLTGSRRPASGPYPQAISAPPLSLSAFALSVSAFALSVSAEACWPFSPHLLALAGWGLLVREVSPTGAPRPSCCCAPLGARVKDKRTPL